MRSLLALLLLCGARPQDDGGFTFVHCSDPHAPIAASAETIAEIKKFGALELPGGGTAKAPSFVVVTGDLTEFGAKEGWESYRGWWKDATVPVYSVMGNHDGTWDCLRPKLRAIHGAPWYSWDHAGNHFVVLDSSSPQEPRPSFAEESLAFLRRDLAKVSKRTPLFLFFHHPPHGDEFASGLDRQRLFDIVRPWPVAGFFVGHNHTVSATKVDGFDVIVGGSTFPKQGCDRGAAIIEVKGRTLRAWWKPFGEKVTRLVLEKTIGESPARMKARVAVKEKTIEAFAEAASVAIDDGPATPIADGHASLPLEGLVPGDHVARFRGDGQDRFVPFVIGPAPVFRTQLGGAVRALRVAGDLILASATTEFVALRRDGSIAWRVDLEVHGRAALLGEVIVIGAVDGTVRGFDTKGAQQWSVDAGAPVYSSPVVVGDRVVVGTNDGSMVAVDAKGSLLWKKAVAGYAIECPLATDGTIVVAGAWDQHVYAVTKEGDVAWKVVAQGSADAKAAKKYYSPADGGPAVAAGRVFIADRAYKLTRIAEGKIEGAMDDAVAVATDGKAFYVRRAGSLAKLASDGSEAWSVKLDLGRVAAAPIVREGRIFVCSGTGMLSLVKNGKLLWTRSVTPRLYVFGSPEVDEELVTVGCQDGTVTAVRNQEES